MLPRWRDQLRIFIAPKHVSMFRYARGWNAQHTHRHILHCGEESPISPWTSSLALLRDYLRDFRWSRAQLHVVLSNHFVHYATIPWKDQLADTGERQAYLRHYFGMAYGDVSTAWELRMSRSGMDLPSLASGVDRELLLSLRDVFTQSGHKLSSVQPHLTTAFNRHRSAMSDGSAWFIQHEDERLCVALLQDGAWRSVRSHAVGDDWTHHFETVLARESVLCGVQPGVLPIFVCGEKGMGDLPQSVTRLPQHGHVADQW